MSVDYLLFLFFGRLLIALGARFVEHNDIKIPFLKKLASCLLCSGVWAYTLMSLLTNLVLFENWVVVPVLSELITGCFSAYLVYLVEMGWKATHEVVVI